MLKYTKDTSHEVGATLGHILVTGGAGYIGSHVTRKLRDEGYVPLVLDDLSSGKLENLGSHDLFIKGTCGDKKLLHTIFKNHKIDAVMHLAASVVVSDSLSDPYGYYENNVTQTLNLFGACVEYKVPHIIYSSTAAVYGTDTTIPFSEDSSLCPKSPYGRSKLMGEWILKDLAQRHKFSYVILRYFNVAGYNPRYIMPESKAQHLMQSIYEVIYTGKKYLEIFGNDYPTADGTGVRDYIHVEDIALAHLLSLKYLIDQRPSDTLNCGYGKGWSVYDVISEAERVIGRKIPTKICPRRDGDVAYAVADAAKIKELLHWSPQWADLRLILETTYNWEKHQKAVKGAS